MSRSAESTMIPVGEKIGYVEIQGLERLYNRNKKTLIAYYQCKCICGKEFSRRKDMLDEKNKQGRTELYSCGCISRFPKQKIGKYHTRYEGYEDVSKRYFNELKKRGEKYGDFDLTYEYLWELFLEQNKKCAISGVPINICASLRMRKYEENTASVDRIDSKKGYCKGNIWWVHKDVNRMKQEFPMDYFLEMCNLIVKHSQKEIPY